MSKSVLIAARHLVFIAGVLRDSKPDACELAEMDQWHTTVQHFADRCAAANPKFKAHLFSKACGLED